MFKPLSCFVFASLPLIKYDNDWYNCCITRFTVAVKNKEAQHHSSVR